MKQFINRNKTHILYGIITVVITFIIVMSCWRLWGTDIKIPLTGYRSDSVGVLLEASNYVKGGSLHSAVGYGAPYAGEYIDGGFGDSSVPMPLIKCIWHLTGSVEAAVNIHAIINILMLSLSMYYICTRYGISKFVSVIAGISYACSAFFLMYGNTLLMIYSFCFYIPFFCHILLQLMICDDREYSKVTLDWKQIIFTIIVMLLVGINSAYYAFMAMIILTMAMIHTLFTTKRVDRIMLVVLSYLSIGAGIAVYTLPKILSAIGYENLVVSLGARLFVLLLLLFFLVLVCVGAIIRKITSYITMKVIYTIISLLIIIVGIVYIILVRYTDYTGNYEGRTWMAVEMGALRIINMIMPSPNNVFTMPEDMTNKLTDVSFGDYTVLGILTGVGYIYSVLNIIKIKKDNLVTSKKDSVVQICGLINAFITLIAIKGGLASVIAMFVTTGIRNYNRICVYISVFSLIAFGILADRIFEKVKKYIKERYNIIANPVIGVLLIFGMVISIPTYFVYKNLYGIPMYEQRVSEYDEWHKIMDEIEGSVSNGGMILQLPFQVEDVRIGELMDKYGRAYDLQVPVILSKSTVWSYGGGHKSNGWKYVASQKESVEELLIQASAFGFEGVYVDTFMYADDSYKNILDELEMFLGKPYVYNNDRIYFYRMEDYNKELVDKYGKEKLQKIIYEVEAQY